MASSYQENFNPNSTNLNYDLGLQNISIIDTETGELINFKDKDLKFQGKPKLVAAFKEDPELFDFMKDKLDALMYTDN